MRSLKSHLHRHLNKHLATIHKHAKDHFIPHRGNGHQPHVLKHRVLLGYSVILILLKLIAVLGPIALPSSSLYSSAITPKNIIDLTNQTRINLNLSKLKENDHLAKAAAAKAVDMLKNQYFSHTSPAGLTPWDWIKNAGYVYRYAGENLAVHFHEAEDVEAGWMASPSHRANIINTAYTEIGVGVANGVFEGVPTTFVVQMFGTASTGGVVSAVVAGSTDRSNRLSVALPAKSTDTSSVHSSEIQEGEPQKVVQPPVVDESKIEVKQLANAYELRLKVDNAETVAANLGDEQTQLSRAGTSDIWNGQIKYNSNALNPAGDEIIVSAAGSGSLPVTRPIALVAPVSKLQQFYVFNEGTDKYAKFFGFLKIGNIDDKVRAFYLSFIVFLGAALLLNFFVLKFHLRHFSVLKHSLVVLTLALFLMIV